MSFSITQTLKDILNIPTNDSNSSFEATMHDAFVNEDATPVLLPSASQAAIGSKANNLSFGTQLSSSKSNQPLDLIEFNIGNYGGVSRAHAIPLEDTMNGNVVDSPVSNELLNNCAFIVPMESMRSPSHLELTCPPPGDGDVSQCTNSNFCKIQNLIDYRWEKIPNVNVLAVCRSKPLIAYVLDPNFSKNVTIHSKSGNDRRDYSSQVVRFVNYEKPSERALSRTTFTSPIADIAFAFKSIREGSEDKLAAIDKNAVINVFGFRYGSDPGDGEPKLLVEKLFEILSADPLKSYEHLHLKWCPFVPLDDDYEKGIDSGMSLAVSGDTLVEVFAVDKICNLALESVVRAELHQLKGVYRRIPDAHKAPITAVHLSNDATVICTAALDNSVKFFDLGNSDGRLLHNWSPSTVQGDDQISCFYFLDDYNYLLENSRHHFWAYLFIGTKGGNISIWDLGGWSLIQNLSIECESSSKESHFEYKIDISAKVIIAVRGENAFVFLLDFIELNSENKREDDGVTTYPRITKIGRFQLYSDILSFVIKRQSTQKLDIFWVSRKSLERCSIDVEQMKEKRSDSPVMRLGNISAKFDDEIEVLDSSIKKLTPLVKELSGKKKTPISTPPSIKLAEMFNKPSPVTPLNTSITNVPCHPRRSSTPSQEVASLLGAEEDNGENDGEVSPNDMPNAVKISTARDFDFDNYPSNEELPPFQNLPKSITEFKLPDNLATVEQLRDLESSLLAAMKLTKDEMSNDMKKVCEELSRTKIELKDASQIRNDQLNKIINGLIKKLMGEMNTTISKGLEEFMGQLRTEVNDVSIQVNKLRESLKMQCDIQKQQQAQYEKVFSDLNKRIQDSNLQNQQLLKQLQQQLGVTQQLLNGVSAMSRSNSAVSVRGTSVTPQPSLYGAHDELISQSLRAHQEELLKKQVEEERKQQVNMILKKMESNDEAVLLEGLVLALNQRDPALITRICRQFENNPELLVTAAAKDQSALLSLLQQLSLSDFRQDKWKGKFLTLIAPALDIKSPLVRRNLSSFLGKLVAKLGDILKTEKDGNLTLVNALLQSYMQQISS